MVAAVQRVDVRRASELARPGDKRRIEQAAALEILEKAGDGLVDGPRVVRVTLAEIAVLVPGLVEDLHEAHPALDHPARELLRQGLSEADLRPVRDRATDKVREVVKASGVREGMVLVSAMHITAGVFVNDNEPGLWEDIWKWLEGLAPYKPDYQHHDTGEDNGDAHLKRQVMGREVVVAVTSGKLDFGPWEQIFYGEFDGRRRKRVLVKIIGDGE